MIDDCLGLQHRIVEMCTGDLSFVSARKFDVEIWAPGCKEWLEVSSCGLCAAFVSFDDPFKLGLFHFLLSFIGKVPTEIETHGVLLF